MKAFLTLFILTTTSPLWAKNLFESIEIRREQLPTTERSVLYAAINTQLLTNETEQFDIQLPGNINDTVVFKQLKIHNKDKFSWYGHLKGRPQDHMIITHVNGFFAGSLYTKTNVYEFSSEVKNQFRVAELITDNFPHCDGETITQNSTSSQAIDPINFTNSVNGNAEIDVMVLYTAAARDAAGGVFGIEATAQAAVDAMSLSFINSQVNAQVRLSYTGLVNYSDSGDTGDDLSWLRNNDQVKALRTAYGADMVSLLVNSGGCGTGYVMNSPGAGFSEFAYQVTKRSCAVGNLTFAHEFGHNLGLQHNPENSSTEPADASFPWSYGHYHSGSYRTVMSYSSPCSGGCGRRQYFSNPNVQFNNLDTGIDGERDSARSLNQTTAIIAAFRAPANDTLFEDDFE